MKKNDVKHIGLAAAIVASLLVTSVFAVIPWFSAKNMPNQRGSVDMDVTHTLTPVQTWQEVYWYTNGCMLIGYTEGHGPPNGNRAVYIWELSFGRTDNNVQVPALTTVVSLKRVDRCNPDPSTNTFYMSTYLVLLAPLESKSVVLTWEEDGTYSATFPPNHNYTISAVAYVYYPPYANDTDLADNEVVWDDMRPEGPLTGDLKIDGYVNILDSIVLGLHFGQNQGDPGWDPNCDLKADGKINILDSIVLGLNFEKHAPGPQYPHPCDTEEVNATTYYKTKAEAVAHVPTHVSPKDCFVWDSGSKTYPWRVIPGTGCAHWVAHQLDITVGIVHDSLCEAGFSIRVTDVLSGRQKRDSIADAQVGDIWKQTDASHIGIVRQVDAGPPRRVYVEHCSDNQGGVVSQWISSGDFYPGSGTQNAEGTPATDNEPALSVACINQFLAVSTTITAVGICIKHTKRSDARTFKTETS